MEKKKEKKKEQLAIIYFKKNYEARLSFHLVREHQKVETSLSCVMSQSDMKNSCALGFSTLTESQGTKLYQTSITGGALWPPIKFLPWHRRHQPSELQYSLRSPSLRSTPTRTRNSVIFATRSSTATNQSNDAGALGSQPKCFKQI